MSNHIDVSACVGAEIGSIWTLLSGLEKGSLVSTFQWMQSTFCRRTMEVEKEEDANEAVILAPEEQSWSHKAKSYFITSKQKRVSSQLKVKDSCVPVFKILSIMAFSSDFLATFSIGVHDISCSNLYPATKSGQASPHSWKKEMAKCHLWQTSFKAFAFSFDLLALTDGCNDSH